MSTAWCTDVLAKPRQAGVLQAILHDADIDVGYDARFESVYRLEWSYEHRRAQHRIVGKVIWHLGAQADQRVG
jgi:hypothetical protein